MPAAVAHSAHAFVDRRLNTSKLTSFKLVSFLMNESLLHYAPIVGEI